jgi:hypothetical protein
MQQHTHTHTHLHDAISALELCHSFEVLRGEFLRSDSLSHTIGRKKSFASGWTERSHKNEERKRKETKYPKQEK